SDPLPLAAMDFLFVTSFFLRNTFFFFLPCAGFSDDVDVGSETLRGVPSSSVSSDVAGLLRSTTLAGAGTGCTGALAADPLCLGRSDPAQHDGQDRPRPSAPADPCGA
ncbi:MAG: hypothetical protein ACK53I_17905, partial [Phenylobacterium sp.]